MRSGLSTRQQPPLSLAAQGSKCDVREIDEDAVDAQIAELLVLPAFKPLTTGTPRTMSPPRGPAKEGHEASQYSSVVAVPRLVPDKDARVESGGPELDEKGGA